VRKLLLANSIKATVHPDERESETARILLLVFNQAAVPWCARTHFARIIRTSIV
jgi:hypothetical protein